MSEYGIHMVVCCGQQLEMADAAPAYNGTTAWVQ